MDPHSSTATTIVETEEADRTRGWVPAFLTALLTTVGLWVLQYLSSRAPLSTWAEKHADGSSSLPAALLGGHLTYFGDGGVGHLLGDQPVRTAVTTATLFVVAYLAAWLGTIGIWPRAWWPVLLGSWFASTLAAALGMVAGQVYRGGHLAGIDDAVAAGGAYGLIYGLPVAFLVSLVWIAVPGKRDRDAGATSAGPEAEPERTSFFGGQDTRPLRSGPATSRMSPLARPAGPSTGPLTGPGTPPPSGPPTGATPTQRGFPATPGTAPETQPVRARTFTAPTRGQGAAYDTAAWKAFARDVRGDGKS